MAELTPPVFLQAGGESAQTSRLAIGAGIFASGVLNAADLLVTAPGGTMAVSVAAGQGWVVGSRASQGAYHVVNDAPKTVTIAASDPTNPRYDRIVANINDAAYSGALNSFVITVVQGAASSSPVEPAIPADSFELARISVGAAVTTIASGNILDRRQRALQRGAVYAPITVNDIALIVRGLAGQVGSIQEWQTATGAVYGGVNKDGIVVAGTNPQAADGSSASIFVQSTNVVGRPIVVRGISGQTGNLTEWQNNAAVVKSAMLPDGSFRVSIDGTTGMALGAVGVQSANAFTISNVATPPGTAAGAGSVYVEAGSLKYRGASGTITIIAPP